MTLRMVRAEVLRIRKNRGVMIAAFAMTLLIGVLITVIPELYRLGHHGLAYVGGERGLERASIAVGFLGSIGAMIMGSAAASIDLSTGVFRDLVATGRSRTSLFLARVAGALVSWVPVVTIAYAVTAGLDWWFSRHGAPVSPECVAGLRGATCAYFSGATPPVSQFVEWYLWILAYTCFLLLVAVGLAALAGSRAITLGILIPFQLFVAPILSAVSQIGGARELLYTQSISRIVPQVGPVVGAGARHLLGTTVTTSLVTAWLVLALWVVVFCGAGCWRTVRRDA